MYASNKKNAIYHEILERLLSHRYVFGQKILVKEISEECGISRQPIMSALSSLQERGFVQITAQVGCEVVNPSSTDVQDFYLMFAANEGIIAGLAAERCKPNEIARLSEINEKIKLVNSGELAGTAENYRRLNSDFHRQLHAMARSPIISARQIANFELSDFFVVQSCGFKTHLDAAIDEHAEIIASLQTGNPQKAKEVATSHIESIAKEVIKSMKKQNPHN